MLGGFGESEFGSPGFIQTTPQRRFIAVLGDPSNHGGTIISHNQDETLFVNGIPVAVDEAVHDCPIIGHGKTKIRAVVIRTYHNGKLVLTYGARAECGAVITPPDRKVYIE
jgi:uncharacterized Zn-binding protein involved in type VI secretion